ncbi:TIM barrel protein [Microbacterium aerolatum]|uniref:sugar phosphate isomerase/epimerase and 4-hydroxyphenylpyruvate domain-containing protein n=1 Tax=Microbacterium aerolatum TaxID=153731 RepID=UPI00200106D1|nr:sugar phosphate isomerase/epimerase and 4-hydroxyphenylpyruvate domain-containing protein [Microbacterium aerolatum]MCK3770684.1 TIM barrel protein [Microbacterium aerolatum]
MRTSIASVCISGGLVEKLHACAEAGFDGVEIMDADLIAAPESPEEIRALCDRLGLKIEMFQPFRDAEGVSEELFADNLRRAEAKFQIMERLGTDLMLVCSNVATATVDDDEVVAGQLGELADRAAVHGIRLAYEALAWGRYVDDYRRTWEIVKRADRPNLGVCLDSFHILSLAHDPAGIEQIDAEKIFFLQLADAPALDMDVLSWSRHHRLFPGEGDFDLVGFMTHVMRAGYTGPWSLEVFNDTFRQTDAVRTAAHAHRSLVWLADRTAAANGWDDGLLGESRASTGLDFVEVAGADLAEVDELLAQLGFAFEGRHRSKPVRLWSAGSARIILNEQVRSGEPVLAGIGLQTEDAAAAVSRALALGSPSVFRRTYEGEQDLQGVAAPDGTQVFWSSLPAERSWLQEFEGGTAGAGGLVGEVDHINLAYAWQDFDEAVLFMSSALSLRADAPADVPGPLGLIRSQVMRTPDGIIRVPINLAPPTAKPPARHIAVRCDDVFEVARQARRRGIDHLRIPANYYDDLAARFDLPDEMLTSLRELDLLYDRDADGEFIHFYTRTIGDVFFEVVERRGGYDGYGGANAPIRLAAQR